VVEKCTFCVQRIDYGYENGLTPGEDYDATPACVNICPVEARVFGNLHDPESRISKYLDTFATVQLRDDLGTDASVFYIPPGEAT
jgi:phenylacetyl-CoA:acceptor oxidoreductase subunit 1